MDFSRIKAFVFDVDGVLTDGSLTFLEDGREIKTYNAKDGLGVVMLSKAGIITSIITARNNNVVKVRAQQIDIKELYMGQKNKVQALTELLKKYDLELMYLKCPEYGIIIYDKFVGLFVGEKYESVK